MLVLTRKRNEKVIVPLADGKLLTITVISIDQGKIRLGFEAPKEIPVYREEVYEAIQRGENK